MIIDYSIYDRKAYDEAYNMARRKIDALCWMIRGNRVSKDEAIGLYEKIESDYARDEPERIELFTMIYRGRILRLLAQFYQRASYEI